MAWLTMRTLQTEDLVDEIDMDAIRQNIEFIQSPTYAQVKYDGGNITPGTSWALLADELSIEVRSYGGPIIAIATFHWQHSVVNGSCLMRIEVDGTETGGFDGLYERQCENANSPLAGCVIGHKVDAAAGLHAVRMRARTGTNGLTVSANANDTIVFTVIAF